MKHFIVFDMDGTLLNTLPDIARAMNLILASHGLAPHPEASYRAFTGNGARMLATRALAGRDDLLDAVYSAYLKEYSLHSLEATRPYDGIADTLGALQAMGIPLFVFSNKDDPEAKAVAAHYFPGIKFAGVLGSVPGVPLKPDPAALLRVLGEQGFDPKDGVYVGDTQTDVACAKAAGIYCAAALWGFQDEDQLAAAGPDEMIGEPGELLRIAGERFR
ncbi:MAG TPA: HAD family hydrolase [Candidatus Limnocylindria bacterium]|nr:HAD family hydrolase [Candidatus Limnocylindria bacterium]